MGDVERYQVLRPMGGDGVTFAARDSAAIESTSRVVVLERVTSSSLPADERVAAVRRARSLVPIVNPRIVRVREVVERENEVLVAYDFVDGEWLSALTAFEPRAPLDVTLRMVLDVLDGLAVLHDLRDERGQPRPVVHGGLTPDTVLVGLDGVAQIARACRLVRTGTEERYVAPELRQRGGAADVRSDIYSVGTILRDILGAPTPQEKWAEPLTEIAWRACSFERESRWPSALTMAAALRRSVGARLATPAKIASFARDRFGERVRARRIALEALEAGPPSVESVRPSDMEVLAEVNELHSDPKTLRPPRLSRPAIGRVELARAADRWGVAHDDEAGRRVATHRGLAPPPPRLQPTPSPAPAQAPPPVPPRVLPSPPLPEDAPFAAPPPVATESPFAPLEPNALAQPDLAEFSSPPPPRRGRSDVAPWLSAPPAARPVRTRFVLQASVVAAGMVLTFVIGWWAGRSGPTSAEGQAATPASAPVEQPSRALSVAPTVRPPTPGAAANLQATSLAASAEPSAPLAAAPPSAPVAIAPAPSPPETPPAAPPSSAAPAPPPAPEPAVAPASEKPAPERPAVVAPVVSSPKRGPASTPAAPGTTPAPKAAAAPASSGSYNPSEL